ncbi:MAG: hypothetical protein WCI93_03100 [bacterium]
MAKKTFQDVVKIKNRPIEENKNVEVFSNVKNNNQKIFSEIIKKPKKEISFNALWLVVLISVVFLFFAISSLFASATVTINPKTKDYALNKVITAVRDTGTEGLSYDLVVLSGEEKKEVQGGEEKDYQEYAKGNVLIYNTYSSAPQTISANTKLLGSNGKFYKTTAKVIIPGMTKGNMPGKIGAIISAENVGTEWNSTPLDFKIVGFGGTSKYTKIYARSVGDITGGLKGLSRQLSDSEKENIIKELTNTLFAKLFEKAKNQTPKDFMLLKDATNLNIDSQSIDPTTNIGSFVVTLKGTFTGILFNKDKLSKEIITDVLEKDDNSDVYVNNLDSLIFSNPDKEISSLSEVDNLTFNLSGSPKIVWRINKTGINTNLLGVNKGDFNTILSQELNIDSASFVIKPLWKNSFPTNSKDIKIIVNYP